MKLTSELNLKELNQMMNLVIGNWIPRRYTQNLNLLRPIIVQYEMTILKGDGIWIATSKQLYEVGHGATPEEAIIRCYLESRNPESFIEEDDNDDIC